MELPSFENQSRGQSPTLLLLRWQDSVKASDSSQYYKWVWNLPKMVEGFNYATLCEASYSTGAYTSDPTILLLRVEEIASPNIISSMTNPAVSPTWAVPNLLADTPGYHDDGSLWESVVNIKEQSFNSLTFSVGDVATGSFVVPVVTPPSFFFNVIIKLWS